MDEINKKTKGLYKLIKVLVYVFISLFFIFLIGLAGLFYFLPNTKQIGGYFNQKKTQNLNTKNQLLESDESNNNSNNKLLNSEQNPFHDQNSNPMNDQKNIEPDPVKSLKVFLDPDAPMISFCSHFELAKSGKITLNPEIEKESVNKSGQKIKTKSNIHFDEESDLRFKAIKPLVKSILQKPNMKALIDMVLTDEESLKTSDIEIFKKADFYKQAYFAYSEMKDHLTEYESVMDRAYLMYKINDLISLKPDLKTDQRLQKFCEDQEFLFNSFKPVEFQNEKKVFERLLQELQVSENDIHYNPNYKTQFTLDFSENNLRMSGGWLEEFIENPQAKKTVPH